MKIRVTRKHIDLGVPCSMSRCPIALAIKEKTGSWRVRVEHGSVKFLKPGESIRFDDLGYVVGSVLIASKATEFIDKFDLGRDVKPFTFNLDI